MEEDIGSGLSAEAAVEKEQSYARTRLEDASDPYLRERLQDLDDLANRLLRLLTGQGNDTGAEMPEDPVLVARNIGPGELLDYGRRLKGVVLEQGSVGSACRRRRARSGDSAGDPGRERSRPRR